MTELMIRKDKMLLLSFSFTLLYHSNSSAPFRNSTLHTKCSCILHTDSMTMIQSRGTLKLKLKPVQMMKSAMVRVAAQTSAPQKFTRLLSEPA